MPTHIDKRKHIPGNTKTMQLDFNTMQTGKGENPFWTLKPNGKFKKKISQTRNVRKRWLGIQSVSFEFYLFDFDFVSEKNTQYLWPGR